MKKILGLIGSPRSFGNCEILIKEISKNIPEKHELSLLRLTDFNINACNGCYQCLFGDMRCPADDDLYTIVNALCDTDALILAVPTYFFKAHSALHNLIDRGLSFYGFSEKIWNKSAIGIGIAGIDKKEGSILLDIDRFMKLLHAETKETTIMYARLPGDIFLVDENITRAKTLAKQLFSDPVRKKVSCPLCGSDTFRFLGKNQIKCMLCSNEGTVMVCENEPVISMELTGNGILLNEEDSMNHLTWLRDMKEEFLNKRHTLKKIKNEYIGNYKWIKPQKAITDK